MKVTNDEIEVPFKEALTRLSINKNKVHTLIETDSGILLGADWGLKEVKKDFKKFKILESGENANKMKHGLAIWKKRFDGQNRPIFFETK